MSDPTATDFLDKMEGLLDRIVPPDTVTVRRCDGQDVTLPGAIPARRQVQVFRLMRDLTEHPVVRDALGNLSSGEPTAVVDSIVGLAIDPDVAERLGSIFDAAYPDALDGQEALDALPVEEIVVALVPFSERFIRRVGGGLKALASSAATLSNE